jgi:hypothetical protein
MPINMHPIERKTIITLLRATFLLFLVGCGLSTYEGRMEDTQNRIKRFEEESKYLDGPLQVPTPAPAKEGDPSLPRVFYRPPKGFATSTTNEKEPRARLLYSFAPRAVNSAAPFTLLEVAVAGGGKEFEVEVLRAYTPSSNLSQRERQFRPPGRDPITYKSIDFDEGLHFVSVNLWRGDNHQVAIVFVLPKTAKDSAVKAMDMSLESFAVGRDIARQQENLSSPLQRVPKHPK